LSGDIRNRQDGLFLGLSVVHEHLEGSEVMEVVSGTIKKKKKKKK